MITQRTDIIGILHPQSPKPGILIRPQRSYLETKALIWKPSEKKGQGERDNKWLFFTFLIYFQVYKSIALWIKFIPGFVGDIRAYKTKIS